MSGVAWYGIAFLLVGYITLCWVFMAALLVFAGILAAPIVGFLPGREVSKNSHTFMSGAWRRAFYSASGLLPWIYVEGRKLSRFVIVSEFVYMHISWLMAILAFMFLIFVRLDVYHLYTKPDLRLPEEEITLVFGLISGLYWIVASSRLMAKYCNWRNDNPTDVQRIPSISSVLYFTFPSAWVIGATLVVFPTTDLDLSATWEVIVVSIIAGSLLVATTVWTLWSFVDCYRSHQCRNS